MKNYTKQRYRYVYPGARTGMGHIFEIGRETAFCGMMREEVIKISKEADVKLSTRATFNPDLPLCDKCKGVLKKQLADEYNIKGWV